MSIFTTAISDIFSCNDFLETCIIADEAYRCICSPVNDNIIYSEAGLVDDVDFTLDIKLPLERVPTKGDLVRFRCKQYKVSNVTYDSAFANIKVFLQGLSKG